jgi:nicotinate-nucleotide adenylyltransferase
MTRIALFGGSFNPPHVAHQLVALYVLETCEVDELWFVPTYVHPFGKPLAPYEDRIAMCELAARALGGRARTSRAEEELARRPGFVASRTLDLVAMLAEQHGRTFRLVIGADILLETHKWYRWDELVRRAPPIVVGRSGHPLPPEATETGVVMPEVSATRVRALLAAGDPSVRTLLPGEVLRYIAAHGLYRAEA